MKGYSHSFSLVSSHSPEVCITVQEVTPPSHETRPEKLEALCGYLIRLFAGAVLQSGKPGDSAARLPRYKAEVYYLLSV